MRGLSRFVTATCVMGVWLWGVYEPLALGLGIYYFSSLELIYGIQAATMVGLGLSYGLILCKQNWEEIADSVHKKMKLKDNESPLRSKKEV